MGDNTGKGKSTQDIEDAIRKAVDNLPPGSVPEGQEPDFSVTISVKVGNPNVKEFRAQLSK
jgi:hypothetical protein